MKPKVQALGGPVARERRDGGQVKLSTFIPPKIRKRGASNLGTPVSMALAIPPSDSIS